MLLVVSVVEPAPDVEDGAAAMKKIVIANWKMNPVTVKDAIRLFEGIKKGVQKIKNADVVISAPFVYLSALATARGRSRVFLSAQDSFWEEKGPFTGEVSPMMLKDLGVTHVVIGHSERRRWLGETDEMVNKKIKVVLKIGLTPILCVGEKERGAEGEIPDIVGEQIKSALRGLKKGQFKNGIVAYEPVWAIGTGVPETPDNATRAAIYIRKIVKGLLGKNTAEKIRIIYGGSVNSENSASFISRDIRGMEGMLVGGASLKAGEFVKIIKSVA